jgi:D-amino-acid dehydrogenase
VHKQLNAEACVELEPALATVSEQLSGGVAFPNDHSGDAFKFTQQLARLCQQRGVTFNFNETIDRVETGGDRITGVITVDGKRWQADHYVMALGSYSPLMAKPLGIRLPVYPVKGYSLTVPNAGMDKAPRIPVVDDGRKLGVTPLGDRLRAAGTAEFNGYDVSPNPARGALLVDALKSLYPQVTIPDDVKPWCGLRPVTPDGPPLLGPTSLKNLYLNCGQGHLGWTMSCGSAKVVSDLISGRTPDIDLTGLTIDRF